MKHPHRDSILRDVKHYLRGLYRDRLHAVILFGSQAREDAHEYSDIDVLIVLNGTVNPYHEIDRTSEFIAQLCLDNDVVISRHFISSNTFQNANSPFLQNVRNEGLAV